MILTDRQAMFVIVISIIAIYSFMKGILKTIEKISANKVYRIMLEKLANNISATEAYAIICAFKGRDMENNDKRSGSK